MTEFSVEDLYLHRKVTELHCTTEPDIAAGTVRSVDREGNKYLSAIWAFPGDGSAPRQLTHGPGLDSSPRWSPDGAQLAFVSDRSGGNQLHVMDRGGGEARQVGEFALGVSSHRWSPDGKRLFVTAAIQVDPDLRGERGTSAAPRDEGAPEVAWKLPYKSDGVGYLLGREIHLHSLDVASGKARQLTDGAFDVMGFDPSPNGRHVAYSRSRTGRFAHCSDLWVCDAQGERHRRLTHELSTVMQPVWSPDGRWIAFAGARKEGDGESRLWLLEFATGELRQAGPEDMEVGDPLSLTWTVSSDELLLVRARRGRHQVVALSVADGSVRTIVSGDRQFSAFAASREHLYYGVDTPVQPSEVFACRPDGSNERRLGELNPWWSERPPLMLESRSFEVPDGTGGVETIEGWLLRAKDKAGPMPLLNDVHGGPAAYALLDYDTNVFWQVLCSRGWAVLMLNAIGSSSFGAGFCKRLSGHWGEYDLPQHQAAIAQLQAEGLCDERIAISGKSYGGYLTAWAVGHTNMFRAAVVMAPVGNIETHYGTSDGGYYADPLYLGTPGTFPRAHARKLSPLQYVEQSETPTLFMQGKEDERCPKCQSEELFVSMFNAGDTPAELVLYPNEDHHFLGEGKPACRADAARRIVQWVTRHAGQEGGCNNETSREKTIHEGAAG